MSEIKDICKQLQDTLEKKNSDYGNSASNTYEKFGDISYLIRCTDKMNRMENLITNKKNMVKDESINDTILDLAGYCIIWLKDRINNNE